MYVCVFRKWGKCVNRKKKLVYSTTFYAFVLSFKFYHLMELTQIKYLRGVITRAAL